MDAITLLKADHKTVEQLFKRFEKAGDRARTQKRSIVDRIIEELSIHAAIEEQIFYPVVRATVPKAQSMTLESLEEHHVVKWVLSELEGLPADAERFDAKVSVLIESVRHHVKEEEGTLFPMVRKVLDRRALNDLGTALARAKKSAPTRPHPRAADTPPANLVLGTAAGVADRVGDTVSGLAQGGVSAIGDLVATIMRREKPRAAAAGSTRARRTAKQVRSRSADATDAVTRTARTARATGASATTGAKRTARAAKSAARGTATSARGGAKRTATTAKRGTTTTRRTASKAAKRTANTARRSSTSRARTSTSRARTSR